MRLKKGNALRTRIASHADERPRNSGSITILSGDGFRMRNFQVRQRSTPMSEEPKTLRLPGNDRGRSSDQQFVPEKKRLTSFNCASQKTSSTDSQIRTSPHDCLYRPDGPGRDRPHQWGHYEHRCAVESVGINTISIGLKVPRFQRPHHECRVIARAQSELPKADVVARFPT